MAEETVKKISNEVALELQLKQARGQILKLQHDLAERDALIAQYKAELLKAEATKLDAEMAGFMKTNELADGARINKNEAGEWVVKAPPEKA